MLTIFMFMRADDILYYYDVHKYIYVYRRRDVFFCGEGPRRPLNRASGTFYLKGKPYYVDIWVYIIRFFFFTYISLLFFNFLFS